MTTNKRQVIIADTSGLVSLLSPSDHNHKAAIEAAKRLEKEKIGILVSQAVQVEFLNVLGRLTGHEITLAAYDELTPPFYFVSDFNCFKEAQDKFMNVPKAVSFTDCLVMALADHYETKDIFGFDKQFADAGYNRLTPSQEWKKAA